MNEIRFGTHPNDVKNYTTSQLREQFLIEDLFEDNKVNLVYSMHDRMISAAIRPKGKSIPMDAFEEYTKARYFLERREMGVINIGHPGIVTVDGETFALSNKECLYIGRGKKEISFSSESNDHPAEFFISSTPAHKDYPTVKGIEADANQVHLGSKDNCNERTIYQFIHEDGIQSCQLVMGYTTLKKGSVWNTFPPHTHYRRMEVYFYFDLPDEDIVMHFMGDPKETRHLVIKNKQGVISPEWSIHAGAATSAYSFIWAMGGENKAFTDMDGVSLKGIQ